MAYSGKEALELLRQRSFDLLITDQGMPGMTGIQLIEEAQALHPDMAVVLATGYAELPPGLAINVPRVAKPFFQVQLALAIREALKAAR